MRVFHEPPLRDIQMDDPVAHCPRCKGEVYRYDKVASFSGAFVHEGCMSADELELCATCPAISFMEEAG